MRASLVFLSPRGAWERGPIRPFFPATEHQIRKNIRGNGGYENHHRLHNARNAARLSYCAASQCMPSTEEQDNLEAIHLRQEGDDDASLQFRLHVT